MLVHTTNGTPVAINYMVMTVCAPFDEITPAHESSLMLRSTRGMSVPAGEVASWLEISVGDRLACFFASVADTHTARTGPSNEIEDRDGKADDNKTALRAGKLVAVYNLSTGKECRVQGGAGEALTGLDTLRTGLGFGLIVTACAGFASIVPQLGIDINWPLALLAPMGMALVGWLMRPLFRVDSENLIEQAISDEAAALKLAFAKAKEAQARRHPQAPRLVRNTPEFGRAQNGFVVSTL